MRWVVPLNGWVKLNCNGASIKNPRHSGGGDIIRDHSGALVCAFGHNYGIHTCMWAEAMAVLDSLKVIKCKLIHHAWLELDSLVLVNMLQGISEVP